jgi:hypothetical protein
VDVAYNERKVAKYGKMRHVEAKQNFVWPRRLNAALLLLLLVPKLSNLQLTTKFWDGFWVFENFAVVQTDKQTLASKWVSEWVSEVSEWVHIVVVVVVVVGGGGGDGGT